MSGAGTLNINGVYTKVPNSENAENASSWFREEHVKGTWKSLNGSFQIYYFNPYRGYWRISDTNPLRYFYKGTGNSTGVTEWMYDPGEKGTKPDPTISCYKGRYFSLIK